MQIKLYELRKKSGLSQKELAKIIKKSETTYRDKELDNRDFTLTEMYRIADFFEKDIGEIFIDSTSRKVNENELTHS